MNWRYWLNRASESWMSRMTLGMVEDSRMVWREAALLFVIEKAVLPGRWISMGWIFFVGVM